MSDGHERQGVPKIVRSSLRGGPVKGLKAEILRSCDEGARRDGGEGTGGGGQGAYT